MSNKVSVAVVVPNWNGADFLGEALNSLLKQTYPSTVIVVENGSTDESQEILNSYGDKISVITHPKNLGFAGGVNSGIRQALNEDFSYIALFNNDAVASSTWLEELVKTLERHSEVGIATCKFVDAHRQYLDSTGDIYTTWGLPYPRGRREALSNHYDKEVVVFGASGGASLYRSDMLRKIGLFDEDFFAYYEDVDISFRAQLAGWKVRFCPDSTAYHHIGATSSSLKGFTTYQTMKNLPFIAWKNVPASLLPMVLSRLFLVQTTFFIKALQRGHGWYATKGVVVATMLLPKKIVQRFKIQHRRIVSVDYIRSILIDDLPPNATRLRVLRRYWWRLIGKKVTS